MSLTTNIDALSTPGGRVLECATALRRREAEVAELKAELPRYLREAQKAGATAKDLIEWTGYSRRTIFYMLKENTK
jgi:hypothetical protein